MSQARLNFGPQFRKDRAHRDLLHALDAAVSSAGINAAAGACEARRQDLVDALADRDGRHMRDEWIFGILDVASSEHAKAIVDVIADYAGYALVPVRPLSAEERLARLEQEVIAELGPAAARIVERNRR